MIQTRHLFLTALFSLTFITASSWAYTLNVNVHNLSESIEFSLQSMTTTTPNTTLQHSNSTIYQKQVTPNFYATATTSDTSTPGIKMTFIPGAGGASDNNSPCTIQISQNKPYYSCSNSCICNLESATISGSTAQLMLTLDYKVASGSLSTSSSGISTSSQ